LVTLESRNFLFHFELKNNILNSSALSVVKNSRPLVISRSSFAGLGHFAGHWTGDVFSTWDDMKQSITGNNLKLMIFSIMQYGFSRSKVYHIKNIYVSLIIFLFPVYNDKYLFKNIRKTLEHQVNGVPKIKPIFTV